ncbi:MAG: SCP2 sterol-binding domain-containing protein [Chloroflexota bacterium]
MATQEEVNNIFPTMMENFEADKADGVNATIQFNLSGDNGGMYWVKIDDGNVSHGQGDVDADMTVQAAADDFYGIATGETNPMQAFMMGKIKIDDMGLGMKMISMFGMG